MLKSKKKEHDWDKNRARGTVYSLKVYALGDFQAIKREVGCSIIFLH